MSRSGLVGKFYGAVNNFMNVLGTKTDEMIAVHLARSYCLPLLLYGCEIWSIRYDNVRSMNVAWNNEEF